MSSGRRVPETRLLGGEELSADHAWRALRSYSGWKLLRDAFVRFRYGDGFSHARALGLQLRLGAVPLLIALKGLASKLDGARRGGRVWWASEAGASVNQLVAQVHSKLEACRRHAASRRAWSRR